MSLEHIYSFQLKHILCLTHKVGHGLAHGSSKDEILQYAGDEGEGHAEHSHHQVADSQRQQEGVGHSPHALVDRQHHDDEQVPDHTHKEDEWVEEDPKREVPICSTHKHTQQTYWLYHADCVYGGQDLFIYLASMHV